MGLMMCETFILIREIYITKYKLMKMLGRGLYPALEWYRLAMLMIKTRKILQNKRNRSTFFLLLNILSLPGVVLFTKTLLPWKLLCLPNFWIHSRKEFALNSDKPMLFKIQDNISHNSHLISWQTCARSSFHLLGSCSGCQIHTLDDLHHQ